MATLAKIGILGSGEVAKALAFGFGSLGHQVMISNRDRPQPELIDWAKASKKNISCGSFQEAAVFGEILVLATLGLATEQAVKKAGVNNFNSKIILDTTNPMDFSQGFPPILQGNFGDSGGERIQRLITGGYVVKVFNTVGNKMMFNPCLDGGRPDMFICGDHDEAKSKVADLLKEFGWNAIDVGPIWAAHYLEAMAMIWILSAAHARPQKWEQAFKMLGRSA